LITPRPRSGAPIVGILLGAGSASRFGGAKLLATLPDGTTVGVAALRNLLAAVDSVIAVVRPGDDTLANAMLASGARVTVCPDAGDGMGASLAWGVRAAPVAAGWLVALADMPWIQPLTIKRVADAVRNGAALVAPRYRDARGHPVGIAAKFYGELATLSGDEGARRLVASHTALLELVAVDDAGVVRDVDTPADLVQ
jgi:molybdenum cofactor cytidylyltransferase